MQDQGLDWVKCVWLYTDRAASKAGCHSGATAKIKKNAKICCLHIAYIAVNIQYSCPETVT